jgi:hypothetical protein
MAIDFALGPAGKYTEMKVRGRLNKEEYVEALLAAEALIPGSSTGKIRVLAVLEDFQGWEKTDWDDERINRFTFGHDGDVERMAVVGPPEWEEEVLAFTGYPFTAKDVRYFAPSAEVEARTWLDD